MNSVHLLIDYDNVFIYQDVTYREHLHDFINSIIECFEHYCNDDVKYKIKIELHIHYNDCLLTINLGYALS